MLKDNPVRGLECIPSGFNPCCIGRYAKRFIWMILLKIIMSFNPCCIGRYAKSKNGIMKIKKIEGFNPCCIGRYAKR